jgi:hypothetical protein
LVINKTKGVYYIEGYIYTYRTYILVISISSLYTFSLFYLHRSLVLDYFIKQDDPLIISCSSIGINLEALYKRGLSFYSL